MRRIRRNAFLFLGLLLILASIFWSWRGAVSILTGGMLALLSFHLMSKSVDKILGADPDGAGESGVRMAAGYLVRLLLILGTLFAIIHFSFLSPVGAVLGLSIYVLAGIWEAILLVVQREH